LTLLPLAGNNAGHPAILISRTLHRIVKGEFPWQTNRNRAPTSRVYAPFRAARSIAAIPAATQDRKKLRSPASAIIQLAP
jgi:hypothetical protein